MRRIEIGQGRFQRRLIVMRHIVVIVEIFGKEAFPRLQHRCYPSGLGGHGCAVGMLFRKIAEALNRLRRRVVKENFERGSKVFP